MSLSFKDLDTPLWSLPFCVDRIHRVTNQSTSYGEGIFYTARATTPLLFVLMKSYIMIFHDLVGRSGPYSLKVGGSPAVVLRRWISTIEDTTAWDGSVADPSSMSCPTRPGDMP